MKPGRLTRRRFLALSAAFAAGGLRGGRLQAGEEAEPLPKQLGELPAARRFWMYRRSLRGRRGSRYAKTFNANMRFATQSLADNFIAHEGDNSRVVKISVSEAEFNRLFIKRQSLIVDLRDLDRQFETLAAGFMKPGDFNRDGRIDIADPIGSLNFIFAGVGQPPCGRGEGGNPSNIAVADHNGDGLLDISDGVGQFNWLFGNGRGHALGSDCVFVEDCPDSCK